MISENRTINIDHKDSPIIIIITGGCQKKISSFLRGYDKLPHLIQLLIFNKYKHENI